MVYGNDLGRWGDLKILPREKSGEKGHNPQVHNVGSLE